MTDQLNDLSRLCIHTMTTKPWSLAEAIEGYARAGVPGITVWRQHVEPMGAREAGRMLRESGLEVVSLCRGGFFPAETEAGRREALDDCRVRPALFLAQRFFSSLTERNSAAAGNERTPCSLMVKR